MKFFDITRTDACYLLQWIKTKIDVTTTGIIMESNASYGKTLSKLLKKRQKIYEEMTKKRKEVLEENNIWSKRKVCQQLSIC